MVTNMYISLVKTNNMPLLGFLNVEFGKLINGFKFKSKPRAEVVKETKLEWFEKFVI